MCLLVKIQGQNPTNQKVKNRLLVDIKTKDQDHCLLSKIYYLICTYFKDVKKIETSFVLIYLDR